MKKGLFILSLLCFSGLIWAQEEDEDLMGVHPYKIELNDQVATKQAHWSLTPHVGFSIFSGDFKSEAKHMIGFPSLGLDAEYHFTPVWGLGLEYMFDIYGVRGKQGEGTDNADRLLKGYLHQAGVYLSMDFVNLIFPHAERKIFSAQAMLTGGVAWYRNTIMYPDSTRHHTAKYEASSMNKYSSVGFIGAGLNAEFNLNRTLALGVRAMYHYFLHDYVDYRGFTGEQALASKNNDGIFDITLNMRIKVRPENKSHVRNMTSPEVWVLPPDPCYVHDTVIIQRYDSVIYRERVEYARAEKRDNSQYFYVYFRNNSSDIDDQGQITIQQVADRLNDDDELYAVVTGYCDNTGSANYNYVLGDKRAANVITELRQEHGVADDHLYALGLGKVAGRGKQAAEFGPNRRAVIRLVDKETFELLKQDLDVKKDVREVEQQTVPLSQSSRKEQVNEFKDRPSVEVKANKRTTLSTLARKYYDNTYCWVYIYLANLDRIDNPNMIYEGTKLVIPELTEDELKVSKEESLRLYSTSRRKK